VNYAPFVSQSKSYEGIQKMMATQKYLAKLVTDRIDKENAKYAAIEASGTVSKPPEEPQVGG
jgi:hypothetical protein